MAERFAKIGGEMVSLTAVEEIANRLWPDNLHAAASLPDPQNLPPELGKWNGAGYGITVHTGAEVTGIDAAAPERTGSTGHGKQ